MQQITFLKLQFALLITFLFFTTSFGQTDWTWRSPYPQGNNLNNVIWTGKLIIAVGTRGTIVTSSDGVNWTSKSTGDSANLNAVTLNGSKIIAVGSTGAIYSSTNGSDWTSVNSGTSKNLQSICWNGSQFAAFGDVVLTSPDGITWTNHGSQYLNSVIWADSQYVAINGGNIYTSQNGSNWTKRNTGITTGLSSITRNDSLYVAVGTSGTIFTSTDLVTWKKQTCSSTDDWYSVTWTGKLFIAVGEFSSVQTSPDGIQWTNQKRITGYDLYSVTWAGDKAVQVGRWGTIRVSPTGENWTHISSGNEYIALSSVWTGTQFVTLGDYDYTFTSTDGISWKATKSSQWRNWSKITTTDSLIVAVGSSIFTSPDAVTWTARTTPRGKTPNNVTWTGNQIVAVGDSGTIFTSPDGTNWTKQNSGVNNALTAVAGTGKKIVAVGDGGMILSSPDGISWSNHSVDIGILRSVAYNGSEYVAVGGVFPNSFIISSPDGDNWTECDLVVRGTLYGVSWAQNKFVAVGDYGVILTSPDGITWNKNKSITDTDLRSVYSVGDQIIIGGFGGNIITATIDNIIAAPKLISPKAGTIDLPVSSLSLTWSPVNAANTYHVQVSTNCLFTNIIKEDSTLTGTTVTLDGLDNFRNYFWRVRAKNGNGVSAWAVYYRFRTIPPPPPAPVIVFPNDKSTSVQQPVTLKWNWIPTAYTCHVQVSKDSNFISPVVKDSTVADSQMVVSGLDYTTKYFWRVSATNTAGTSLWSNNAQFTTSIAPPASAPVMIAPANYAGNQLFSLAFKWNRVASASSYHFVISKSNAIFRDDSTLTDTSTVISDLQSGSTYYWRVQAKNDGGTGAWSSNWQFYTISIPNAPTLLFPFDKLPDFPDSILLIWNKSSGAKVYHYQIATDTGFTKIDFQDSTVTDTLTLVKKLSKKTWYYWRVRAGNAGGWGKFSVQQQFGTFDVDANMEKFNTLVFKVQYSAGMLKYTLAKSDFVSVEYLNVQGKKVGSYINCRQGPGSYSLSVQSLHLAKGTYIQVFRAGEKVLKDKVTVFK